MRKIFIFTISLIILSNSITSSKLSFLETPNDENRDSEGFDDYINRIVGHSQIKSAFTSYIGDREAYFKSQGANYYNQISHGQRVYFDYTDDFNIFQYQCLILADSTKEQLRITLDLFFNDKIITEELASNLKDCFKVFKSDIVTINLSYAEITDDLFIDLFKKSSIKESFRLTRVTGLTINAYKCIVQDCQAFTGVNFSIDITNNLTSIDDINFAKSIVKNNSNLVKLTLFESSLSIDVLKDFICASKDNISVRYLLLNTDVSNLSESEINGTKDCLSQLYSNRATNKITEILPSILAKNSDIKSIVDTGNQQKFKYVFVRFD